MDSYAEEIWRERLRYKVDVDRIKDLESLKKQISEISDRRTVTRTTGKGKSFSYTMDTSKQKQILLNNIESLYSGSPSVQSVIEDNMDRESDASFDRRDLEGLRRLRPYGEKEKKYREALEYNLVQQLRMSARDANDVEGLEGLKASVSGLPDAAELQGYIQEDIDRLKTRGE